MADSSSPSVDHLSAIADRSPAIALVARPGTHEVVEGEDFSGFDDGSVDLAEAEHGVMPLVGVPAVERGCVHPYADRGMFLAEPGEAEYAEGNGPDS